MVRIGKVVWAIFWLSAAIIVASVLAYRVISWWIDRDLAKVGAESSYVRYSTDLLKVGQPDLYTVTRGNVRLQVTASDAFLQWGDSGVIDGSVVNSNVIQGSI